jgi:hypothetical protein
MSTPSFTSSWHGLDPLAVRGCELPHPDRTSQSLRLPGLSTDSLTESPDVTVI